jgi:drug/metabolite transporter (DMT)-like permease
MSPLSLIKSERQLALVAWIAVCLVWGTTYLGIRVALESVPVALLAGLRWTTAGLLLAAAVRLSGQRLPGPRTWPALALVGFLMNVVGNGFVVWAEQSVASGLAAVVVAMVPFWGVAFETLLPGGERLTARTVIGLTVGFAGIVVLVWPELTVSGAGNGFVFGIIALQLACIGWALGQSFSKRYGTGLNPLAASAMQMIFGGLMLTILGTATGEWSRLAFTPRTAAAMIYLVLFGSIVGYSAYVYALRHLPVSTVSLYAYVNPIIAVVLGAVLLSEPFDARVIAAAALVLAGIAVVRSKRTPRAEQVQSSVASRKAVA